MLTLIGLILLLILTILLSAMLAALSSVSTPFVRYWARNGDPIATNVYVLKARGQAVVVLLELTRALSLTGAVILLSMLLWPVLAWLVASLVLMLALLMLPQVYLKPTGMRLLSWGSPAIMKITSLLAPVTKPFGHWLDANVANEPPMALTREELSRLLESTQPDDTDLSGDELRLLKHALNFGDKTVRTVMTPRRIIAGLSGDEVLSPAVLDELHQSGHSRFPVFDSNETDVRGILYVHDLIDLRDNATVADVMRKQVYYVNEERELDHVLQAFLRTKHHLFIVTNSFAEITGLITIEDVLEQVIGRSIVDEFDEYQDLRAVAARQAKDAVKQHKESHL